MPIRRSNTRRSRIRRRVRRLKRTTRVYLRNHARSSGGRRYGNGHVISVINEWIDRGVLEAQLDLTDLNIDDSIIAAIPGNVKNLNVESNNITNIDMLPDSIINLNVSGNPIETIHHLPDNLEEFAIAYSPVKYISAFPPKLKDLHIGHTEFENGIPSFPDGIEKIFIWNAGLEHGYRLDIPRSVKYLNVDETTNFQFASKDGESLMIPFVKIGTEIFRNMIIDAATAPRSGVIASNIRFTNGDMQNALLTEIMDGNIVVKVSGTANSLNSRNYVVINSPEGDNVSKLTAREQKQYLMQHGNPVTRQPVRMAELDKRKVRK